MRIAYVTSTLPMGAREGFFIGELSELVDAGHSLTIAPVRPERTIVHGQCRELMRHASVEPLLSLRVVAVALVVATTHPRAAARSVRTILRSRSGRILLKNVAVLPKALWLSRLVRRMDIEHLHATWLSTPATAAMIAADFAGISWSASAHRWDIEEDNLLACKLLSAAFVRAISDRGAAAVRQHAESGRVRVIRMGVEIPPRAAPRDPRGALVIAGNLIAIKGHRFAIDALAKLRADGLKFRLDVLGDGPLRQELEAYAAVQGVADDVRFCGQVPHEEVLSDLVAGRWVALLLPSVIDEDGATEGVPVVMLEAMARGVPVVASDVGAVAEAAGGGAAVLVPPGDPGALADAICQLLGDGELLESTVEAGYTAVEAGFHLTHVVRDLEREFALATSDASSGSSSNAALVVH